MDKDTIFYTDNFVEIAERISDGIWYYEVLGPTGIFVASIMVLLFGMAFSMILSLFVEPLGRLFKKTNHAVFAYPVMALLTLCYTLGYPGMNLIERLNTEWVEPLIKERNKRIQAWLEEVEAARKELANENEEDDG